MPDLHVNVTGDAGSAIAALAATQAAIDALSGKSVDIDINVNDHGAAMSALRDLGSAMDRTGGNLHVGVDSEGVGRARDDIGGLRDDVRGAARDLDRALGGGASRGGILGGGTDDVRSLRDELDGSSSSMSELQGGSERTAKSLASMWDNPGPAPDWATGIESSTRGATEGVKELNSGMSASSRYMVDAEGSASRVGNALEPIGRAASSSAMELKDFGDGIYRATGGAEDGIRTISALGRVMGGGSSFLDDPRTSYAGKFSQMTSGLQSMGSAASGALDTLEESGGLAKALPAVGMGALVATVAIGALDLGVAALGAGAGLAALHDIPGGMQAVSGAEHSFSSGMRDAAQAAGGGVVPALQAMKPALRDLGAEFGALGASNLPNTIRDAGQLAGTATEAMKQLAPAIKPAEDAFTTVGKAVMLGIGGSVPALNEFSNAVNQNGPGLQNLTQSLTSDAARAGSAVVKTGAAYGNAFPGGALLDDGPSQAYGVGQLIGDAVPALKQVSDSVDAAIAPHLPSWAKTALGVNAPDAISSIGSYGGYSSGDLSRMGQGTLHDDAATPLLPSSDSPQWDANKGQSGQPGQPANFVGPQAATGATALNAPTTADTPPTGKPLPGMPGADKPLPGADKPAPDLKVPTVGSSLPQATSQAKALTAAVNDAQRGFNQLTPASQQAGQSLHTGLQQGAQSAQQLPQHVAAAANQIPQAVAQPMRQVPKAMQAAIPPAAMSQPVQAAVQHVASAAPAASDAGSDVGTSVGDGMQGGMTKTITKTLTLVENWVTKIIDTAASGLDAHSPSRVFMSLGESIGTGLQGGIQSSMPAAVAATNAMVSNVVGGAAGQLTGSGTGTLGGATAQLNTQLGQLGTGTTALPALTNQLGTLGNAGKDLHEALIGPKGALPGLDKYVGNVKDKAQQHAQATRLMSDGNAQITGNPYSSGGGANYRDQKQGDVSLAERLHAQDQQKREQSAKSIQDYHTGVKQKQEMTQRASLYESRYGINTGLTKAQESQAMIDNMQHPQNPQVFKAHLAALQGAPAAQQAQQRQQQAAKGFASDNALYNAGKQGGNDLDRGMADGLKTGAGQPEDASGDMAQKTIDKAKDTLGVHSPSTVFSGIGSDVTTGMVQGIGNALTATSDGLSPLASNAGLQVGYTYGTGIQDGVQSIIKSADFQSAALPDITSELEKVALGAGGFLPDFGSGAQIYNNPAVSLDSSNTAGAGNQTITINLQSTLDGAVLDRRTLNIVGNSFGQFANDITVQPAA